MTEKSSEEINFFEKEDVLNELLKEEQKITIRLEVRKFNKPMTIIEGINEKPNGLEKLASRLKSFCACGGTVKDGKIYLQGDQRQKSKEFLQKNGYQRSEITVI